MVFLQGTVFTEPKTTKTSLLGPVFSKTWEIGFWDCIEFGSFLFNFHLLTCSVDNNG
jgi:hypothetical protein